MKRNLWGWMCSAAIAALPAVMLANSGENANFPDGPPLRVSGAPADGGQACNACHAGSDLNSGPGRLVIRAKRYIPGERQRIEVELRDPAAERWGFELIARLASDETKQAGAFNGTDLVKVRCDGGEPNPINRRLYGTPPPCGDGVLQFASHSSGGTVRGVRNRVVWEFDWTAPAEDLGQVVFYAAGNAANGDNTNRGDRVYTASLRIGGPCNLTGTPRITGVGNSASGSAAISPVSLISVFGSGFAGAGERNSLSESDLLGGRVPNEFGCLAVEVNGRRAPVFYTQTDQINAQAPILEGQGPQQVRVILNPGRPNERRSDAATAEVAAFSPAWFLTAPNNIAAINISDGNKVIGDPAVIPGAVFAKPADIVTLFGTGFGYTQPVWQAGEYAAEISPLRERFTITVGGTTLGASDVLFAGLSPEFPGFYQVNLRVPASAPNGAAPVVLEIGGVRTQTGAGIPVRRP